MEKRTSLKRANEIYMEEVPSFFYCSKLVLYFLFKSKIKQQQQQQQQQQHQQTNKQTKRLNFLGFFLEFSIIFLWKTYFRQLQASRMPHSFKHNAPSSIQQLTKSIVRF